MKLVSNYLDMIQKMPTIATVVQHNFFWIITNKGTEGSKDGPIAESIAGGFVGGGAG